MNIVPLSRISEVIMGQAPAGDTYNSDGVGIPLIAGAGDFGAKTPTPGRFTTAASKRSQEGDIILCVRATIGDLNWSDKVYCLGRGVAGIRPKSDLADARYVWWALAYNKTELKSRGRGATFKQVNRSDIETLPIPLPPLSEQRRLAGILDDAERLRRARAESIAGLDRLKRAAFSAAFGDLSEWPVRPFGDLVSETRIGLVRGASQFGDGMSFPYVRMNAISRDGRVDRSTIKSTDASKSEAATYSLRDGDFLFNTRNSKELVGKSAIWRGSEGSLFNNNIMRVRFNGLTYAEFVQAAFGVGSVKRELETRKTGTTSVFAIYWRDLKTLPVPLPPVNQQASFAETVKKIDDQRIQGLAHLALLDSLFSSLQHRAFRGEL